MFTKLEKKFMQKHGIASVQVMDARKLRPVVWKATAKEQRFDFALWDHGKCGHRLRTRSNNCCQCNPASIDFQSRHEAEGWIYLAYLPREGLLKIGSTGNLDNRLRGLKTQGYGNGVGWVYIAKAKVNHMGRVEQEVRRAIRAPIVTATYQHRNSGEANREVVRCTPTRGWWHFIRVVNREDGKNIFKHPHLKILT